MLIPGKETKEKRLHSTAYIPYSYYHCRIPTDFANVPMHWHSELELDYVVHGQGEFTCGGEKFLAEAGSVMLLPPNLLHSAYPWEGRELQYDALVFSPQLLGANLGDRCAVECLRPLISRAGLFHIPPGQGPDLQGMAQTIFRCAKGEVPQGELLLRGELLRLLWSLATGSQTAGEPALDSGEAVRPVLEYMLEHYPEPVTVAELAGLAHLSESYFMSCFKRAVGLSAMEYLSQLRVNAACELLASTQLPVSEIAFSVGFGNLSNFNRHFKRSMGCTPRAFRQGPPL